MKEVAARICQFIGLPGAAIIISCLTASWFVIGCSTSRKSNEVSAGTTGKSGAQLWSENCVRCHNIRSPSNYSPAQWEVVMLHMRVRANLTPEEHKKILEFLKSGS
jgi:hypothetical protein